MAARDMSGTRPWDAATSTTAEQMDIDSGGEEATSNAPPDAGGLDLGHLSDAKRELVRSGSMNLPKPDESGVPATHPDMCILRIRRNHLVEVRCPSTGRSCCKRHPAGITVAAGQCRST